MPEAARKADVDAVIDRIAHDTTLVEALDGPAERNYSASFKLMDATHPNRYPTVTIQDRGVDASRSPIKVGLLIHSALDASLAHVYPVIFRAARCFLHSFEARQQSPSG